ncbi:MAG: glycerol-3-phosphate dehydrogenase (NAD(P)+) [Rhodospirillaceae bacterium]|nr:MAG: glycerol-3-phosphate dehydrogenase (NAD(P)+) [Rhodospirillaceae bacterium]
MNRVGIVGAGAWGTALAMILHRAGRPVVLWAHGAATAAALRATGESPYLPGVRLPRTDAALCVTTDPGDIAQTCDVILLVAPAQHLRAVAGGFAPFWRAGVPAVICAKGLESHTNALMHEVVGAVLPTANVAVLSGPSFAAEIAEGLPAALTLACADPGLGQRLVRTLGTATFRLYLSDDVPGAEIGGAVKNVLAIGCGIVAGRALGDNARAALITRGLAEIIRLAVAVGARAETVMGLCGLGDLILTASSLHSRNFSLGVALGQGKSLADILANRHSVAEGVHSAAAVVGRARALSVEMPLCQAVHAILNRGAPIDDVICGLLTRPFRTEIGCLLPR